MAEKKYLDLTGLGQYDAKIKKVISDGDDAALAAAKEYANGLASNYDAAGSAASAQAAAEATAKAYTDAEVAKANAAAASAQAQADKGVEDAGKAQAAADKAQGEVDDLEAYVGTFTASEGVDTVVKYIDKKTEGIASEGAMTELAGRVTTVEGKVATIEGDYLKAADKTELSGLITAEAEARAAADSGLDERLVEVEAFFKLAEGEQLDTALDTLVEIQGYITSEGAAADQMVLDIAANKAAIEKEVADRGTAISGVETAYKAADEAQAARIEALEAKFTGDDSVADQIADAVAAEATLREQGDAAAEASAAAALKAGQDAQKEVDALEGVVETLTQTVAGKVAQGDHDALASRVTTAEGKITTLEGASHTHGNKTVLDGITAALVTDWNDAVAKEHEHSNKEVLDGITAQLVSNWNAAEGNAKAYTDEKIAEFVAITSGEVDALFA